MVNFAEAAECVLREAGGGPLHFREITERAVATNLVHPQSATPWTYMSAAIAQDSRRRQSRGEVPRFATAGRGFYRINFSENSADPAITQWNESVKQRMRRQLLELEPSAFEQLIGNLLERIGFEDIEVTQRSKDGGIDVRGVYTIGGMTRIPTAVQVKRWSKKVPPDVVQALRGALNVDEQGLVVTTSMFTASAIRESKAPERLPIGLVDGSALVDLLAEYELGFSRRQVVLLDLDEELLSGRIDTSGSEVTASNEKVTLSSDRRFSLFRPPGRTSRIESVSTMLRLVTENQSFDAYVNDFQREFREITRPEMAERYARTVVALGLASIDEQSVFLTALGKRFLSSDDGNKRILLVNALRERVYGFGELEEEVARAGQIGEEELRAILENRGLSQITPTKLKHVLGWSIGLGLMVRRNGVIALR